MAKETSTIAKVFKYLSDGVALRKERAKQSGKSTAALIVSETRGDICSEQLDALQNRIAALNAELADGSGDLSEQEREKKVAELHSLEQKKAKLTEQRDKFYQDAEATSKIMD